ncbi:o-succinylbenzoate synthase [Yersinia rochesterensis]|uniref:o-succinylbenzoate synthase n=1 Tax=Yersinia rochesterensis TaxID=1604335 RepID=A0A386HFZ5_9GAMM|nr:MULTISPECIES: o-succinylbenzoate synthase [Yersinia]AJI88486.1 o-succinylbenzoate synthase [Yersinia frederiksenii Y225]CNG83613.1 O-succinylbenzoate synthase [Yersinia kristensenii]AIN16856.1 o-succinylbenzoate synthase [Yersinia rochesterensis]AJJ34792.1 o-succinylbenzoate synthase [Yersinia rochesterensis]AYD44603.1 o-succinylbenzoate synthase [Yersinia rochesterensis]
MRAATLYRYSIPMEAGVILRHQRLKSRDGLLVKLQQGEQTGWGEIAPLPEFSQETLPEAQAAAITELQRWVNGEKPELSSLPSVDFGLSCALAELDELLPLTADYRKAPLCTGDPDELFAVLQALPGEKVAKVKVGLYEAVRDGMIVNVLLEALPDLKLRLDANRSWTRAKAEGFAKYVNPELRSRIAFLEEPCKTRAESREFARDTGIAIAWDESVREADFKVEAEPGVVAIVIKPTLVGSIARCQQLVQQAHQAGLVAVISSSIESSLGLTQLARLAAWLTPATVPGLDTLNLMQAQVVRQWPDSTLPLLTDDQLDVLWHS